MLKLPTLLVLLTVCISGYSQSPSIKTDSTLRPDQPRVVVFNNTQKPPEQEKPGSNMHNVVKFNFLSSFFGDFAFQYERKLGKSVSVELGPGITFRNYFLGYNFEEDEDTYLLVDARREFNAGYSFNAGIRFYPSGAMSQFYFMPDIRFRRYNSTFFPYGDNSAFKEHIDLTEYKMNFGYVFLIEEKLTIDCFLGTGIRNKAESLYFFEEEYDYNTDTWRTSEGIKKSKTQSLALMLGLKFGLTF